MKKVFVKYDGSSILRFNWPGDEIGDWSIYEVNRPVHSGDDACGLIEELLSWNGYSEALHYDCVVVNVIEEDHIN